MCSRFFLCVSISGRFLTFGNIPSYIFIAIFPYRLRFFCRSSSGVFFLYSFINSCRVFSGLPCLYFRYLSVILIIMAKFARRLTIFSMLSYPFVYSITDLNASSSITLFRASASLGYKVVLSSMISRIGFVVALHRGYRSSGMGICSKYPLFW